MPQIEHYAVVDGEKYEYYRGIIRGKEGAVLTYVTWPAAAPERLEIPSCVDGIPVISIGRIFSSHGACVSSVPKTVVLPEGLVHIGDCAFRGEPVEAVEVADSVEFIGDYAMADCKSLEKIILPKNLSFIGKGAFHNSSIKFVHYHCTRRDVFLGETDLSFGDGSRAPVIIMADNAVITQHLFAMPSSATKLMPTTLKMESNPKGAPVEVYNMPGDRYKLPQMLWEQIWVPFTIEATALPTGIEVEKITPVLGTQNGKLKTGEPWWRALYRCPGDHSIAVDCTQHDYRDAVDGVQDLLAAKSTQN